MEHDSKNAQSNVAIELKEHMKFSIKLGYLKIGDYLPWKHIDGYYIYFRPGKMKVVKEQVTEEVYEGMKEFEGQIKYSDKTFKRNTESLEELHDYSKNAKCFIDLDNSMPGRDDTFTDMVNVIKKMSDRDIQIAQLKFEGITNQEIADQLAISLRTVERRLQTIRIELLKNK